MASDRNARAVRVTSDNAARGGFAGSVAVAQRELAELLPPAGRPGLVLINPPYGRRLDNPRGLRRLSAEIGRWLRSRCAGWHAGVLVPARALEKSFGLPLRARHDLHNGGL